MPPPLPPAVPVLVQAAGDAVGILAPGTLATADLHQGSVALLHCLVLRLLGEGDGAGLLEVLLADLLLAGLELGDIGVVALLRVLVGALQDGILLQAGHLGHLVHAAEPGVGVRHAPAEVHPGREVALLPALAEPPAEAGPPGGRSDDVSSHCTHQKQADTAESLKYSHSIKR